MTTPYIAPGRGIDALKDAIAAIRCAAAGDAEGFHAILNGTDAPRHLAAQLASVAVVVCSRFGVSGEEPGALLTEMSNEVTDAILDQPRPEHCAGGESDG